MSQPTSALDKFVPLAEVGENHADLNVDPAIFAHTDGLEANTNTVEINIDLVSCVMAFTGVERLIIKNNPDYFPPPAKSAAAGWLRKMNAIGYTGLNYMDVAGANLSGNKNAQVLIVEVNAKRTTDGVLRGRQALEEKSSMRNTKFIDDYAGLVNDAVKLSMYKAVKADLHGLSVPKQLQFPAIGVAAVGCATAVFDVL